MTKLRDLPTEIVLQIATYLYEVDHICFALTCKSLLHILGHDKPSKRSKYFWPRNDDLSEYGMTKIDRTSCERWQLLERLEDSHWRLCSGCSRLHPAEEFSTKELANPARDRICVYGRRVGIVSLCPCIDMTFRDRLKIVEKLSSGEPRDYKLSRSIEKLVEFNESGGSHNCSYTDGRKRKGTKLQISFRMILDQEGNLVVETAWEVLGRNVQFRTEQNYWLCPHQKFEIQVLSLREFWGYSRGNGMRELHKIRCRHCQTRYIKAEWESSEDPESYFRLITRRRFGRDTNKADKEWYQQTETAFEDLPDDSDIRRHAANQEWQLSPDYAIFFGDSDDGYDMDDMDDSNE